MYDDNDFATWLKFSNRKPKQQTIPVVPGRTLQLPLGAYSSPRLSSGRSPQRVTVKISYGPASGLKRHLSYIERDGKGFDGSKPEIFGEQSNQSPTGEISGEQRIFRVILSPENGSKLHDMQDYTRAFMQRVNDSHSGGDLQWFASVHYNTANPHSHIVIRGIDTAGKEVLLDRNFVCTEARQIASKLATQELGRRTRHEINSQVSRELVSERFTTIDRAILRNTDTHGRVAPTNQHQRERLQFLQRNLNLAYKNSDNTYQLDPNFKQTLDYNGRKQDIVKTIYNDMPTELRKKWTARGSDKHLSIYQNSWKVQGTVTAAGIADELTDRAYLVIESKGKPYYFSDRSVDLTRHRVGDLVCLRNGQLTTISKTKQASIDRGDAGNQGNMPSFRKGTASNTQHDQGIER